MNRNRTANENESRIAFINCFHKRLIINAVRAHSFSFVMSPERHNCASPQETFHGFRLVTHNS